MRRRAYHPCLLPCKLSNLFLLYEEPLSISGILIVLSDREGKATIFSDMGFGSPMADCAIQSWVTWILVPIFANGLGLSHLTNIRQVKEIYALGYRWLEYRYSHFVLLQIHHLIVVEIRFSKICSQKLTLCQCQISIPPSGAVRTRSAPNPED